MSDADDIEPDERREKARVHVQADIEVAGPQRRVHAVLKEISRDSARLTMAEVPAAIGELIELYLPAAGGIIEVMGEIVRAGGQPPAHDVVVHFALVEPAQQRLLDELLQLLLAGAGGGQRLAPRIARRMEILFGDGKRALLVDVSRGGLGMITGGPFQLGQEVVVTVGELTLRGKVVNQRMVRRLGRLMYHAGVQLAPVDAATQARLDAFIQSLL